MAAKSDDGDRGYRAVIEIVSAGCEDKDRIGLFSISPQGICDLVVYDTGIGEVIHATPHGQAVHVAGVDLGFAFGCTVTTLR